jgi:hypothetical protein
MSGLCIGSGIEIATIAAHYASVLKDDYAGPELSERATKFNCPESLHILSQARSGMAELTT